MIHYCLNLSLISLQVIQVWWLPFCWQQYWTPKDLFTSCFPSSWEQLLHLLPCYWCCWVGCSCSSGECNSRCQRDRALLKAAGSSLLFVAGVVGTCFSARWNSFFFPPWRVLYILTEASYSACRTPFGADLHNSILSKKTKATLKSTPLKFAPNHDGTWKWGGVLMWKKKIKEVMD